LCTGVLIYLCLFGPAFIVCSLAQAQSISPTINLVAADTLNDEGKNITLTWAFSATESDKNLIQTCEIYRSEAVGGPISSQERYPLEPLIL